MGTMKKTGNSAFVQFGLLNVDASIIRDVTQHMLRQDIYGSSNPRVTLIKGIIQYLLEYRYLDPTTKQTLNRKLTELKINKIY